MERNKKKKERNEKKNRMNIERSEGEKKGRNEMDGEDDERLSIQMHIWTCVIMSFTLNHYKMTEIYAHTYRSRLLFTYDLILCNTGSRCTSKSNTETKTAATAPYLVEKKIHHIVYHIWHISKLK